MKTTPVLAALIVTLSFHAQAAPTVKTSGVRVIRETIGEGFEGLTPFNAQKKGTALALIVESGGGSIIKMDLDSSSVDSFTDDKGTDLLVEKKGFNKDGFGHFPRIAEDGKAGIIEINSGAVPAKGATELSAKGTLVLQTASKKKAIKSTAIDLKKGTALTVGEIALKVKEVGKPSFGEDALEIELETNNKAIERVAEVKFFDAAGKQLESRSSGSSSMGFGKKFTYGRSYSLKKAVKGKVVVQFEVWTDFAEQKVPFTITAGIGG